MAELDPRSTAQADGQSASPVLNCAAEPHRQAGADGKGAEGEPGAPASLAPGAGTSPSASGDERDDRSGLDRAEALVDNVAATVSSLIGVLGRKLLRLSSRARESAQDFWAQVQDFRRGKRP